MHRFFIPPEWIQNKKVTLVDDVAHQIKNVLRMQAGRKIIVLDNTGMEYHVDLVHVARSVVVGEIFDQRPAETEPNLKIVLYQGTLKAQKFEFVLQKGTELGITAFVPVICERSVLADVEAVDEKIIRWRRIIREAAEQSHRSILPALRSAMIFPQACQQASETASLNLLAWEDPEATGLRQVLRQVETDPQTLNLFIGSEGGYTLDEARLAHHYDIHPVWLGKRIFRAESAGLIAASAILYHFGAFE